MVGLKVTLLGGFEARLTSGAPVSLPPKKAQALLAYLGVRPGQPHQRDKLAALLWGEKPDGRARDGLRHALVALRKALGAATAPALLVDGQTIQLNAPAVEVDAAIFEQRVADGTPRALEQAADLYRGDLLLGFTLDEPLFEEGLLTERERLREMALEALARLLAQQTETASTERAIQTAVRLLALDPLQEAVHRTLMRLYGRQGRRGAALKQYQICVGALRRELGTEPEGQTKKLYQELLRRPVERTIAAPPGRAAPAPPDLPAAETALFGRHAERAQLRAALDATIRGQGQVVTVLGEAGIGKTRLVTTLWADALSAGCKVLIGHCHESDSILSFGPWVDAVRSGGVGADQEVLGAMHPARRGELTRLLPEASIAGLPSASAAALPLFESVAELIEQLAAREPLVVMLEDLHWADEMSLRLLAFVSRRIPPWKVLVVATVRDEELIDASIARQILADLSRTPGTTPVTLAPLSRSDTGLLVQALVRAGADAPAVAEVEGRVWAMSEGNPFVAVEAMRVLDRDRLRRDVDDALALPASVRALTVRRLERLAPAAQRVTGVAAVIGRQFDFALLRAACGGDEREVAEAVEEMVRHRVLEAAGHQLDFAHDRVREIAYARLLAPQRRLFHRAVAEALEASDATDPSGERIEQLARHAVQGEWWDRAVGYLRLAGARASARSAFRDARAWFEQALAVVAAMPESRATLEDTFEIHLGLRQALAQLGEGQRVRAHLRDAEALAERLDDDHRRGRVWAFMTNIHVLLGDLDAALEHGRKALDVAGRLGDVGLRILTTTYLEQAHYFRGNFTDVVELATANLAALPPEWVHERFGGSQTVSVNDRCWLFQSLANLGRFAEAARYAEEAIRLATPTSHPYTVGLAHGSAAAMHVIRGDWARARAELETAIAVLRTTDIVEMLPLVLSYSAMVLATRGEGSQAVLRLQEAESLLEAFASRGRASYQGFAYHALGRACFVLGRLDEALRLAGRAADVATDRSAIVPRVLHLLGDIASQPDAFDADRAERHYREALALAETRGMRPQMAHCHLGLGALHRRTREHQRAAEHLETAVTMYRDMDMSFWLEQAQAETRELG